MSYANVDYMHNYKVSVRDEQSDCKSRLHRINNVTQWYHIHQPFNRLEYHQIVTEIKM